MQELNKTSQDYRIIDKNHLTELWTDIYVNGYPDWSHIMPYYEEDIVFKDAVQEIHGKEEFRAMTKRLTDRAQDLKMFIHSASEDGNLIILEWEMVLSFKKYPSSSVYGISRVRLNENGKIVNQRDYYDLWGDIFDNIPNFKFNKRYRKFMKKKFG